MKELIDKISILFGLASKPRAHAKADEIISQGHRLEDEEKVEEALDKYREAVRVAPRYPRAHLSAGNALLALERLEAAAASYREAIRLDPSYAHAHFNLGNALQKLKRPDEAMAAYRVALSHDPALAEAHVAMGCILEGEEKLDQAIEQCNAALLIKPGLAGAWYNLGNLFLQKRDPDKAEMALLEALRIDPDNALAHWRLASTYTTTGFSDRALEHLHQARLLDPNSYAYHSYFLFCSNYLSDISDAEIFAEHVAYGDRFCPALDTPNIYANDVDPQRRLRIGYVSGDFRQHPVLRFIEPLLERHCRDQVEVFCYNTLDKPDAVTERLKTVADRWRETLGLDDDAAAELIRDDQIDILVDLSGHTGYQRLAVFARKPAPVQATWLGYLGTTGIKAMDYRICDFYTDPPGLTEQYHTEKLARLPDCQWCYRPPQDLPDPTPLPMLRNGYLTFGSFNNIAKLSDQVLILWAHLMQTIPNARLLIAAMPASVIAAERMAGIFESHGVSRSRLDFRARQPSAEYYRTCQEADIALDPFPYNGGTTSIDILFMGVPILTLEGTRSIARGGVTLLSNLDLRQFIARTEEEYLEIGRRWANDPSGLAALRRSLPGQVATSPLMDELTFVRNMERLYRDIWKKWAAEQGQGIKKPLARGVLRR